MKVYEAGLIIGSVPIVQVMLKEFRRMKLDLTLRSALLDSLLTMAEATLDKIEHLEGSKIVLSIESGTIRDSDGVDQTLIAYMVFEKIPKFEKINEQKFKPLLRYIIREFIEVYSGRDYSEISQFQMYKINILTTFGFLSSEAD